MVWIRCKNGTPEYWLGLTEEQARELDGDNAVELYEKYGDFVRDFIRKGFGIKGENCD